MWGAGAEAEAGDAPPPAHARARQAVSTSELRAIAGRWSLAGDRALLQLLENMHQNIVEKSQQTTQRMEEATTALDDASVALQNVNNRFAALSNTQFIESRVYDDEEAVPEKTEQEPKVPQRTSEEQEMCKVSSGLQILEQFYDEVRIVDSDSDTDTDGEEFESLVLRPKNLYSDRPLPYIIGSKGWKEKWHAGLLEEDSDTDSSTCKKEKADEQYSSSEESAWMEGEERRQDIPPNRDEDAYSDITAMSEDSATNVAGVAPPAPPEVSEVKPSPSDFAAELARRLGGDVVPPLPTRAASTSQPEPKRKTYTAPPPRLTGNVFLDEPPPLDDTMEDDTQQPDLYEDEEEDDIFADLRNTNTINKPTNAILNKPTTSTKQYGGLFDDLVPQNVNINDSDIFDDFTENRDKLYSKNDARGNNYDGSNKMASKTEGVKIDRRKGVKGLFDDEDDDLFADAGILNVVKVVNTKQIQSGLFDDDESEVFTEKPKLVVTKKEIQLEKSTDEVGTVKKPVGAISLFGSKQGTESIGAAILKHRLRKPSTSSEDEEERNVENPLESGNDSGHFDDSFYDSRKDVSNLDAVKVLPHTSSANDVFDDLFAQAGHNGNIVQDYIKRNEGNVSEKLNERKVVSNIERYDNEGDNFDDLFTQSSKVISKADTKPHKDTTVTKSISLFNDDDDLFGDNDIFTSTKIKTVTKQNVQNIFEDEDDLFSNVKRNPVKDILKTVKKSSSLFDDDDDLFASPVTKNIGNVEKSNVTLDVDTLEESKKPLIQDKPNILENKTSNYFDTSKEISKESKSNESQIENISHKHMKKDQMTQPNETENPEFKEKPIENENINPTANVSTNLTIKEAIKGPEVEVIYVMIPESSKPQEIMQTKELTKETREEKIAQSKLECKKQIYISSNIKSEEIVTGTALDIPEKLNNPGDDFFDTIFDVQPPVFEKPKEPKKSKNVNALFDDDSDDEGLFLRKDDALKDINIDAGVVKPCSFGLFNDEPPELDDDIEGSGNDSGKQEEIYDNSRTDHKDGSIDFLTKQYSGEDPKISKGTLKNSKENNLNESYGNKDNFQDLEYFKTVRNFDELNTRTKVYIEQPPEPAEKLMSSLKHSSSLFEERNSPERIKDTVISKLDTMDGVTQSTGKIKSIGKLRPMNLNINVQGLLPGASPKKIKNIDKNEVARINCAEENAPESVTGCEKTTSKPLEPVVKSISFDKGPESPTLINTYSKERAKIQVKRRPSTRKARKDAIRKSAANIDVDSDISVDITDICTSSLPTSPEGVTRFKDNFKTGSENKLEKDMRDSEKSKTASSGIVGSKEQNIISEEAKLNTLGKVYSNILDNKDTSEFENSFESKSEGFLDEPQKIYEPDISKLEKKSDDLESGPAIKKDNNNIFDSKIDPMDTLFVTKPKIIVVEKSSNLQDENKTIPQYNEFDELFQSSNVKSNVISKDLVTSKEIDEKLSNELKYANTMKQDSKADKYLKITKKTSLFEDDLSDEDLFGAVKKTGVQKLRETKIDKIHAKDSEDSESEDLFFSGIKKKDSSLKAEEKTSALSNQGMNKKKSLFGDEESDDDIFGIKSQGAKSQVSLSKVRSTELPATSAEQVFEDPLSFFDD